MNGSDLHPQQPLGAELHSRSAGAPLFGHRPVSWGRHAGAVFGAAFVCSAAHTAIAMLTVAVAMRAADRSLGSQPLTVVAIATIIMWIPLFLVVLAEHAIAFTLFRIVLTRVRRNFGAAYLAAGLLLGVIEAGVTGIFRGATPSRELVYAAAIGVLGGFVYWLIAARDREAVARETQAITKATFA